MKMNLTIVALAFAVIVVLVAGCTSSNNTSSTPTTSATTPTATVSGTPHPTTGGNSGNPTTHPTDPTDAQATQAENLAAANSTISNALASGYSLQAVSFYDYSIPTVVVQYMKATTQEQDEYLVVVDLSQNKVTNVTFMQKPLPTGLPGAQ